MGRNQRVVNESSRAKASAKEQILNNNYKSLLIIFCSLIYPRFDTFSALTQGFL